MTQTVTETVVNVRQMPLYKVLIHNDPVTTFEFVVQVLVQIFNKDLQEAAGLAYEVHHADVGLVGVYPLEHAEFLVDQTVALARTNKFPLALSIEPA